MTKTTIVRLFSLLLLGMGMTGNFAVAQSVDLSPVAVVPPDLRAGVPFTIEIDVYNNFGPGVATSVSVTDILPQYWILQSYTVATYVRRGDTWDASLPYYTLGPSTNIGNTLYFDAGRIPYGFYRPIFITAMTYSPGNYINQISVSSPETDVQPANNSLLHVVNVQSGSLLKIFGGQVIPEQSGSNAVFTVFLTPSNSYPVTVDYRTINGTATAGQDYQFTTGTLTFPPGVTNLTVSVPVLDDNLAEEGIQSFGLQLTNPVNATLSSVELNYIADNEPPLRVAISNAQPVIEGWQTTNLLFPVYLSSPADVPIQLDFYPTGGWTNGGTVYFPAGTTNQMASFPVVGNLAVESNRIVQLTFFSPSPFGSLANTNVTGLIIDDDGQPGNFDHLEISAVPSPQIAGRPFTVTLTARDYFNNVATNYLTDLVGVNAYYFSNFNSYIAQTVYISNFAAGIGSVQITYTNATTNASITAWKPVGTSYTAASTPSFKVMAPPALFVSLPSLAGEGNGVLTGAGVVCITNVDVQDVVVSLNSGDVQEITVPSTVTIPAGQMSAVFDVTIVDDNRLDGTRTSSVFANAPSYIGSSTSMNVQDNETAILGVALPSGLSETSGLNTGSGTVFCDAPVTSAIRVSLSSSDTTELTVPSSVFIQAGQTSATFTVTVPDDALIDGPQTVTVTASVPNWTSGIASTVVQDNDTNITVTVSFGSQNDTAQPAEGSGVMTNSLRITLGGVTSSDVTVNLTSSYPSKVIAPPYVIIPAGSKAATNDLTFPDDLLFDGDTNVTITATAPGFVAGVRTFTVYNNDVARFTFLSFPTNQVAGVPFNVNFTARDGTSNSMWAYRGNATLAALRGGIPLPVTPQVLSNFSRGTLSRQVTVNGWGSNVVLVVTASNGMSGESLPFNLAMPTWATNVTVTQAALNGADVTVSFPTVKGRLYQLEAAVNLASPTWVPVGAAIVGSGSVTSVIDPGMANEPVRVYRLKVTQ